MGEQVPEFPSYFIKSPAAIIGTNDDIIYPQIAQRVEYEGELALVIKTLLKTYHAKRPWSMYSAILASMM
jgi:2-keto-4-pentenoate hydratase/2-oxohepta-3-ene-1,7-dioic acid hydratase in catechol pathway